MSVRARSLPAEVVVAVSAASRAIGELAGILQGSSHRATRTEQLRRSAAGLGHLDVAVRCALLQTELLDEVRGGKYRAKQLTSIAGAARWAIAAVIAADELERDHVELMQREGLGRYGPAVLDLLAEHGEVTVPFVVDQLGASPTTAGRVLERSRTIGVVEEITGRKRDRIFRSSPMLKVFDATCALSAHGAHHNGSMVDNVRSLAEWAPIVAQRLFERSDAKRVIVFGSVARGEERPDSDLDLLVVLDHVTDAHDDAVRLMMELRDIPISIDVLVTDDERLAKQATWPGVVRVALREGRVIERAA